MEQDLPFDDFTVDAETQTVVISKTFNAGLSQVWLAFTTAEILDRWVAPAPWQARTKYMDFSEGGRRFYAMIGPEEQEGWLLQSYQTIHPMEHFKLFNAFADKDENAQLPGSYWDYTFDEQHGKTTVRISIYNESLARMQKMMEMGFKEGFAMSLDQLEKLLASG